MKTERKIIRTETPEARPGFLGAGHMARQLAGTDSAASGPFIFLMDDVLDKKDTNPSGGAHPHAGFETVSLLLEGEIVAHGPFIADSAEAIPELYRQYRAGRMPHIATVPAAQRILL